MGSVCLAAASTVDTKSQEEIFQMRREALQWLRERGVWTVDDVREELAGRICKYLDVPKADVREMLRNRAHDTPATSP